jgi:Spy/CpxP family protein refolding chaperone
MRARGFEAERLLALLESDRGRQLLGISDEQATRLRQITVDAQKTAIRTKADLAVRGLELRELLVADNPDRATVLKKVDEVSALTGTLMKQHVEALLSAKTVLTPEQQQKIRELSANWRLMRGTRGGRPGMPGGPGGPPMAPRPAGPPSGPPPGEPPVE